MRLVGGEAAHGDPAGAGAVRRRGSGARARARRHHGGGWDDRRAAEAGLAKLALVERRHREAQGGTGRQRAQLRLGPQLVARHAVVPGGVEVRRRHVVVVHDQRLGARLQPRGDRRRSGELVDEDVPALGLLRVAREGTRLRHRFRIVQLDVDLRTDAAGGHDLAQAQRVAPDRVAVVQHRDELVDGAHDRAAACSVKGTSRLTNRSAAVSRSSSCQPPAPRLRHGVAARGVGQHRGDGCGQRVRVLVGDQDPCTTQHLGHRTLVEGHDRQTGGHGFDHRHAEALVLGGHDEHVSAGVGGRDRGVARMAGEADRSGQAQLGHVAVQRGDVGVGRGLADDVQRRLGVAVGPRDRERGDRALERLVGGHPADGQPARAPTGRRRRGRCRAAVHGGHGGVESRRGWDHRRGGEPHLGQVRLVVGGVGDGQGGARRQQAQVTLGTQLPESEMVVPRRHQLGRRDVVVVDDERLGPSGQPGCHGRGRGELVDDDVAPLGRLRVGEHGNRLPRCLGVDRVDVDLRAEPTRPRGVA